MLRVFIDIETLLIIGIPLLIILISVRMFLKKKNRKSINLIKELIILFLGIYILLLLGVTLFPINIIFNGEATKEYSLVLNLIPFKSIIADMNDIGNNGFSILFNIKLLLKNIAGNLILLTPLGILAPMLWKSFRKLKNCVLLGIITSVSIEIIQLVENYFNLGMRTVDIDDLILNVLGIILGYLVFKILFKTKLQRII